MTWKATGCFCPLAFPGTALTLKWAPKQNQNAEMDMLCKSMLSTVSEKGILHLDSISNSYSNKFQQILREVFATLQTDAHLSSTPLNEFVIQDLALSMTCSVTSKNQIFWEGPRRAVASYTRLCWRRAQQTTWKISLETSSCLFLTKQFSLIQPPCWKSEIIVRA